MSQCVRGSLVYRLLMMAYIGAFMCTTNASTIHENWKNGEEGHNNGNHHGASLDSPADDIGWRDWLLVEDTQPSPSDANSGLLVRRITPKSVFVAPSFSGCSDGYRQDGMGRCVKVVKVNQAAQLDFLLQKLNSMYAPSSTKNKNDNSDNSGPFHVSLPLGGSDSDSNNNNNNYNKNVPNYNNKPSITSITMKPTTEASLLSGYSSISNSSDRNNNNNNNSSSEIGTKKTDFLQNVNLPITTTQALETIAFEPQQNVSDSNTTEDEETTTNIFNLNIVDTLTTLRPSVASLEESQQSLIENIFDSTVKREPQNKNHSHNSENEDLRDTKKPFVIVVANTTYRPFDSTGAETFSTNAGETVSIVSYDSSTLPTNRGTQTATETTIQQDTTKMSTIPNNNPDTTETITTSYDSFTTILSTTTKTTDAEQYSIFSTTETTPFGQTKFETISEDFNLSSYFPPHITTTMIPNTSVKQQVNKEIDHESIIDEEDEDIYNGDDEGDKLDVVDEVIPSVFGDVIPNNKNIRQSSGMPLTRIPVTTSLPIIGLSGNIRKKCPELNYGRISYGHTNLDCEPQVTTVRYPIRTTTSRPLQSPYYVRFPIDNRNHGYTKTNNYIRFPEQSSSLSSSSYASSPYGTKLWNTDTSASSASSMWYHPSWLPFLQPHKTWPQDDNNHRNQQFQNRPMSTIYHKQYHQQHVIPQNVPSWINSQSSWSQRD